MLKNFEYDFFNIKKQIYFFDHKADFTKENTKITSMINYIDVILIEFKYYKSNILNSPFLKFLFFTDEPIIHNICDYFNFFIYLTEKDPNDLNKAEKYILDNNYKKNAQIFPIGKTFEIDDA